MKTHKEYPPVNLTVGDDSSNMKIASSSFTKGKKSNPANQDIILTLRLNGNNFKELIKNAVRNTIIDEVRFIVNESKIPGPADSDTFSEKLPVAMLNNYRPLTSKEHEIMEMVLQGLSNRKIAFRLNIKINTVKNHMKNIFSKLCVSNRIEACNVYKKLYGAIKNLT